MALTYYERINLINQFKILKLLDKEKQESYDYKIKILERGYEGLYSEIFIELTDEVPEKIVSEVFDILHMYSVIRYSYDSLNDDEKDKIDLSSLSFNGFMGHQKHHYVMDFLRNNGYFGELEELELGERKSVPIKNYLKLYKKFEDFHENNEISFEQLAELEKTATEIN